VAPKNLDRLLRRIEAIPDLAAQSLSKSLETNASELSSAISRACATPEIGRNIRFGPSSSSKSQLGQAKIARGLSWRIEVKTTDNGLSGHDKKIYNPRWEEFGVKPHWISYFDENGKRKTFATNLRGNGYMHPGARPRPFFWPTVRLYKKKMKALVAKNLRESIKGISRL